MFDFEKLPHRPFRHVPVHIVYRLKGSLPKQVMQEIREEYQRIQGQRSRHKNSKQKLSELIIHGESLLEQALHYKSTGPYHLSDSRLARIIIDSWLWLAEHRNLRVFTVCIMSNHVHVLASSGNGADVPPGEIMKAHKNFTAQECNRLIGKAGQPFWEVSYFDRDVRSGKFSTVMWYILNNPVTAGLVDHWEEWPHTYLNPEYDSLFRSARPGTGS